MDNSFDKVFARGHAQCCTQPRDEVFALKWLVGLWHGPRDMKVVYALCFYTHLQSLLSGFIHAQPYPRPSYIISGAQCKITSQSPLPWAAAQSTAGDCAQKTAASLLGWLCAWIKGEQGASAELYTEQAVSLHLTQAPRPAPQKGRKKRMMAHVSFQGPGEPGAGSRSWGGDETAAALLEDLSPLPHPHALVGSSDFTHKTQIQR